MIKCFIGKNPAVCSDNGGRAVFSRRCCRAVFLLLCVASLLILSGCKKKKKAEPSAAKKPPASRMEDKEYVAALQAHRDDQKVVARERNKLAEEMKAVCERVRGSLASDIDDEEFKAALEENEEWRELLKKQERLDQDVRDVLRQARETVRARLSREQAEKNAAEK